MRTALPSGTPVEVVRPVGPARVGIVLLPDIWGLRPLFDDHAARLSRMCRAAVAVVEPFPGPTLPMTLEARVEALRARPDTAVRRDLLDAASLVGVRPVVVLGFCMGGMEALKASAIGCFDLAVSCYGMIRVPETWRADGRSEPLEALDAPGRCPVLALVGGRDPFTLTGDVARLAGCADTTVITYPAAEHGFAHDPSRPTHRPADTADLWARVLRAVTDCVARAPRA